MPEKEWNQIQEIKMFIPISEQQLNETKAIQSFQKSLTLRQKSDQDDGFSGNWGQDEDDEDQPSCHSDTSNNSSNESDNHNIYENKDKKKEVSQAKR